MPGFKLGHPTVMVVLGLPLLVFIGLLICSGAFAEGTVLVNLGDDITTQEDVSNTFISMVSYTGTKGLSYGWSFGDGFGSSAQMPTHTYTQSGEYTVTLVVTDTDGVTDSDTMVVTVLNVRPIAVAGVDRTVNEGTSVTFDGSNSWDTASDIALLTYAWDFGDGTSTEASTGFKVVTHTYKEAGVYITRLVVRDDDWMSSNFAQMESMLVTISGSSTGNGTVDFAFGAPSSGGDLNTTNSSSGDGGGGESSSWDIYWDFGDGNVAHGNVATHNFSQDGTYIVTLIITDAFGSMSVHSILVTVLNSPPTANAGPDLTGDEDEELSFNGGGSDPGGGPLTYLWDFGDGQYGSEQNLTHSYTQQGTYTITLTVTDADGLTDSDTCIVVISNVIPIAGLTSNHTTEEGDIIGFYGTTSYDTPSDLPLLIYYWEFGDGSTAYGSTVSHAYADEGTFTVTLTVTDDDNAVDSTTMTFTVDNADPVASITSVTFENSELLPGENVTFKGSHTDAGLLDTHSYSWSFGDGDTSSGDSTTHSYSTAGTYTVTLTVTDNDGGSGTDTYSVTVSAAEDVAEDAQDMVEDAHASSFDHPKDQETIEEAFDDFIEALEDDVSNINGKANSLLAKINSKVSDEDLRDELVEIIERILESLD